ncbi:ribulose-1,5-bisphosphate carboxylase/oxygenase large subunit [Fodinibius roseus]|uniref:Ribulose 1,5-bisphosphate carboxylase large subunit n=1 Tax=Fodinibius roseus TaxID=1194090 RepID=A0A1M5GDD5_9BACT|nr:RuBisCO large subunit C-terminal-like domain-containing protein [Fodinibius roseus]SHG01820.1 ribulose-1,5-bisphosphate carboxylase/oxygenase large subunit [Fodinibius roseus]
MSSFTVTYQLTLSDGEAVDEKIGNLCLEQSVELPAEVLDKRIRDQVVGRPRKKKQVGDHAYEVTIAWPLADVGSDISQFLNLLYGNISLKPGIKITKVDWSSLAGNLFKGPRVGIEGVRRRYNITARPLSATALKPLGCSSKALAELAFQFAAGGIDLIKDDHGLANQMYAPFEERVRACVGAVRKAAQRTGRRSYYFPNITADAGEIESRYRLAEESGADGVLLSPHIAGLTVMHRLARMEGELPIIAHPAFAGSLTMDESQGFAPDFLYGQLWRALGADFVIYPNTGGRFSFTLPQCRSINKAARRSDAPFKASLPMPGGGIKVEHVSRWMNEYGADTCFLIGGSLYRYTGGIEAAAKIFATRIQKG